MNPSDAIEAIEKPLSSLPYSLSRHILEHLRKLTRTSLQNDYSLPDSLTERIWLTLISQRISRGELREFELADGNWKPLLIC